MTNEELRDGLAKVLACCEWDNVGEREISVMRPVADAALAFIQQHNDTAERLAIAERALVNHGYRKSCDIPACNCGNQWNHGGHAVARLSEIDNATGDHWRNGELLRDRVNRIVTAVEQHNDFARRVREVLESGLADTGYEYDWAISSINKAIALCDEELRNG